MTLFARLSASDRSQVLQLISDCDLFPVEDATRLLLHRDGQRVVGCVGYELHGEHSLLRSLAVTASERGHGYGRDLTARVLEEIAGHDVADVWLLTSGSGRLFAELGFEIVPRPLAPPEIAASSEFESAICAGARCMHRRFL